MTPEQEKHLQRIKDEFCKDVDVKYRRGEAEHGGDIWLKPNMLENALDEAVDLYVYLKTLKDQLEPPRQ